MNGDGTDTTATRQMARTPTINQLVDDININGTAKFRTYSGNGYFTGFLHTTNARYTGTPGSEWDTDINGPSLLIHEDTSGVKYYGHAATAPGVFWANAAWGIVTPGSADVQVLTTGDVAARRNVTALDTVTGGLAVTATTGNVQASAGNVIAAGTVVGDAGPGLLKGVRHYSTGTALAGGDFAIVGWGATATKAVAGTDEACTLTIATAGGGYAPAPSIVFTYKQGTWTTAPIVDVRIKNDTGAGDDTIYATPLKWTVTATAVTITVGGGSGWTPAAGVNYEFVIKSVGY